LQQIRKYNAILDREAYILNLLFDESKRQEEAFQNANPGTELKMNMLLPSQSLLKHLFQKIKNSRRIIILDFNHVATKD